MLIQESVRINTRSSATAELRAMSVEILSSPLPHSCAKITFERLAVGNDLEGDSRSLELPLFNRLHITSYSLSVVTRTLYGAVSEILPHLQCT